eukprot:CAMPEP_0195515970 /NCGR_PEP_ID=MMETSP0794_2-20130614/6859_1 /TAXON_ID=515487 /ORGANISM="Stephanopyxis turris, Strain CCMP 815" /LENGTH=268 /DNA_ID=CAMNT_0040644479 /DNA_START=21 /DNA_END=827 /DNA_ORIENTATION=-
MNLFDHTTTSTKSFTPEQIRSLNDFVGDLCTAFLQYGAQYDVFTRCIRFFLCPSFPPTIVTEVIAQLKDVLYLLTTQKEWDDIGGPPVVTALDQGLLSGEGNMMILDANHPTSSSAQVMDAMADALRVSSSRLDSVESGGVFYMLSVCYLAKHLVVAKCSRPSKKGDGSERSHSSSGLGAARKRLMGVKGKPLVHLVLICKELMLLLEPVENQDSKMVDKNDFIQIVLDVCVRGKKRMEDESKMDMFELQRLDVRNEDSWKKLLEYLN